MATEIEKCSTCGKEFKYESPEEIESIYLELDAFYNEYKHDFCSLACLKQWIKDNKKIIEYTEGNELLLIFTGRHKKSVIELLT